MKIIIAPDSYKGCMRSGQVCDTLASGIFSVIPDADIVKLPMADGGEGTVEAVVLATGGQMVEVAVRDPLGRTIRASYGLTSDSETAVMEMAAAGGIELLQPNELNPWHTSTYGVGQMLRIILASGVRDIIIGIGGSATNDGGAGMAQALGYHLLDAAGKPLPPGCSGGTLEAVRAIDDAEVIPELRQARIRVACDVTNPLLGPTGAATVYAPQKGADPLMVKALEHNLTHFSRMLIDADYADDCSHPGDGAAGGLGFGLRNLCGVAMVPGTELMIEITGFKEKLAGASLLITGEGCTDSQTAHGKLCTVLAQTASDCGVPSVLVSGALRGDISALEGLFVAMFSTVARPCSLDEAMASAPENLQRIGRNLAGILKNNCSCDI